MLRALELERHYSKEQLLEAYLNLAPYGGNIEGAGAASEIYFGKTGAQNHHARSGRAQRHSAKSFAPRAATGAEKFLARSRAGAAAAPHAGQ